MVQWYSGVLVELTDRASLPDEGAVVGRYRLGTCRARERVYASFYATRMDSQSACILRILRAAPTEPRILRFEREREAMRQLAEAPHVVRLLDWGVHGHRPYLVTDDTCGRSLQRVLSELRERGASCDARRACRILHGVAIALQHAHLRNVYHCALDPSKVWIDVDGQGNETGRVLGFSVPHLRGAGQIVSAAEFGNAAYSSLSQSIGSAPRPSFDVFAWGTLMLELLCGHSPPPIAGWGEHNRPDLRALRPELPPALLSLVEECIAADPRLAIQEMSTVLARVEAVLGELPVSWDAPLRISTPPCKTHRSFWRPGGPLVAGAAAVSLASWLLLGMVRAPLPQTHLQGSMASLTSPDASAQVSGQDRERYTGSSPPPIAVSAFPAPPAPPFFPDSELEADLEPRITPPEEPANRSSSKRGPRRRSEAMCRRVREAADRARKQRDFPELLSHLRHRSCFDHEQHRHLKVLALLRLHRYKECVAAGQRSKALIISRRVAICRSRLRE